MGLFEPVKENKNSDALIEFNDNQAEVNFKHKGPSINIDTLKVVDIRVTFSSSTAEVFIANYIHKLTDQKYCYVLSSHYCSVGSAFVVENVDIEMKFTKAGDTVYQSYINIAGNFNKENKVIPFGNININIESKSGQNIEVNLGSQIEGPSNRPIICKNFTLHGITNGKHTSIICNIKTNLEAENFSVSNLDSLDSKRQGNHFHIGNGSIRSLSFKFKELYLKNIRLSINSEVNIDVTNDFTIDNSHLNIQSRTEFNVGGDTRISGFVYCNPHTVVPIKTKNFYLDYLDSFDEASQGHSFIRFQVKAQENIILNFIRTHHKHISLDLIPHFDAGKNIIIKLHNLFIYSSHTNISQLVKAHDGSILIESNMSINWYGHPNHTIMSAAKGININAKDFAVNRLESFSQVHPVCINTADHLIIANLHSQSDVIIQGGVRHTTICYADIIGNLYLKVTGSGHISQINIQGHLEVESSGEVFLDKLNVRPKAGEDGTHVLIIGAKLYLGTGAEARDIMKVSLGDVVMQITSEAYSGQGDIRILKEGNYSLIAGTIHSAANYHLDKGTLTLIARRDVFQRGDIYIKELGDAIIKSIGGNVNVSGKFTTVEGIIQIITELGKTRLNNANLNSPKSIEVYGQIGVDINTSSMTSSLGTISVNAP